jgi:hypothetical protein
MECISTCIKEEFCEFENKIDSAVIVKEGYPRSELSLNSQLQSQYTQSNNSKRQRPNESKIITFDDIQQRSIQTPESLELQKRNELSSLPSTVIKYSTVDDSKVSTTSAMAATSSIKKHKRRDDIKGSGQIKFSKSKSSTADGKGTDSAKDNSPTVPVLFKLLFYCMKIFPCFLAIGESASLFIATTEESTISISRLGVDFREYSGVGVLSNPIPAAIYASWSYPTLWYTPAWSFWLR